MTTDMQSGGIPEQGFSVQVDVGGFYSKHDIDDMIRRMERMMEPKHHPFFGAGMALMFAMNILMPACLNFQEGIMHQEVKQQKLLDKITNEVSNMQELFNSSQNASQGTCQQHADQMPTEWEKILKQANNSVFGRDKHGETELYNQSGSFFQTYETATVSKDGAITFSNRHHEQLGDLIYTDWKAAAEIDKEGGDNGVGVKSIQDVFNNLTTVTSGQQGSVQSAEKYHQQLYSSIETAMKNTGQYFNTVQKIVLMEQKYHNGGNLMPKGVNSPNVFAELQEVSENFIDTLTRAETVQAGALTLYINTMEQVLQVYQGKIKDHATSAREHSGNASKVQYHTAEMSMYSNQADNMKTIFSSNEQSTTQVVNKEGTDMSNYVEQAENGMQAMQTACTLTQSAYV